MCIRRFTIIAVMAICCAIQAMAAEPRSESNAKAIQDFGFEQITFKTTLSEFKKAYRGAVSTPKSNVGLSHFAIYPEKANVVMVDFLDEQLLQITLTYTAEQLKGLGDAAGMRARLVRKLGTPDRDKEGVAAWESGGKRIVAWERTDERSIRGERKDGGYIITILDNGLDVDLQNRKKKLDAGFDGVS